MSDRPIDPDVEAAAAGRIVPATRRARQRRRKLRGRKPQARAPPADAPADAYSIREFCRRHGISEAFFFKLKSQGRAPVMMTVGTRKLISVEAAAQWRREREAATDLLARED
jgi:hypothetical protein